MTFAVPAPAQAKPTGGSITTGVTTAVRTLLGYLACGPAPVGQARCGAQVVTNSQALAAEPHATGGAPAGFGPVDLQSAYALASASATLGAGRTIAVVGAYDDPNLEADLAVYRSTFGLPPCTVASGCLTKINQAGGSSLPRADVGWATEQSLDADMVSAICPRCNIVVAEANSPNTPDLGAAVNSAAFRHPVAIANSYGGAEMASNLQTDNRFYDHPGIAITASTGDRGFATQFPASSPFVTAVGGTTLTRSGAPRGWSETVWSAAGSGCSKVQPKPAWQHDPGCAKRTIADVSAVGDPKTGVAVYDSYGASDGIPLLCALLGLFCKTGGWEVVGGTSVGAPIIAGVYALAGNTVVVGSFPYGHTGSLNDVTTGANGSCGNYLCSGAVGYDGPSGLGTPQGIGAF